MRENEVFLPRVTYTRYFATQRYRTLIIGVVVEEYLGSVHTEKHVAFCS
jgi:hypothetical protein